MNILITGAIELTSKELFSIKKLGYNIEYMKNESDKINTPFNEIDIIICNDIFNYYDIKLFTNLKYIHLTSSGLDRVPLKYIEEKKIELFTAKGVYSIPLAEWTILKILEILNKSKFFYENQKNNLWKKNRDLRELNNSTVSIIGYGSIGKEISKKLTGFNTFTIAVDRKEIIESKYIDEYFHIKMLEKALMISDIVIITLPLKDETRYLFNYELMSKMRDDSILINLSRGEIIKEKDLLKLLFEGKFLGCGLDVFENEPLLMENQLWQFDRVYITPHNGFVSDKNHSRLFKKIYENLREVAKNNENCYVKT